MSFWQGKRALVTGGCGFIGTFLVRSGVLTSVHAFATDPARGVFILAFLAIVIGGSLALYAARAGAVGGGVGFALISRESEMQGQDRHRVIAIDGPAASGKSSVARQLARRLDFVYVNSGAMYRAITWSVLNARIDPADKHRIAELVGDLSLGGVLKDRELHLLVDNVDLTEHLHEDRVNSEVSRVSTVPEVRNVLLQRMRDYANKHDLVVEGRDIGSVVFSDTPYKFYIDASPEVRAQRRAAQGHRDEIARRDRADSSRATSPLIVAKDAEMIDTSNLTIDGVVDEIVARLRRKRFASDLRS